jgi:hypothetical protein
MNTRCRYPRFKYYFGSGITVCDEWKDTPELFVKWAQSNGYAEHLTIDRIDRTKGYCPSNCRWVTYSEQAKNRKHVRTGKKYGEQPSKYKGVCWDASRGKWSASLKCDGHYHFLGRFDSEENAAAAYDRAAKHYFGVLALTNH